MTRRIVLTGPECTGKTTLATVLAAVLRAPLVLEAARGYAEESVRAGRMLAATDVELIARRAIALDDTALASQPALLVLDTDLVSTVVYARHYYGRCPPWIEAEARARRGELYLLCNVDLPWTADGVRDRPTERERMWRSFRDTLAEFGGAVAEVSGSGQARERAAFAALGRAHIEQQSVTTPGRA